MKADSNHTQTTTLPRDVRVGPPLAVADELFAELSAVAEDEGCELLYVGRNGPALQLVIDHPEGITHDLCGQISRQAGALLDGLDYSNGRYVLEVSSPGLDREFHRLQDFTENLGRTVKVVHHTDGRRATVRGELLEFDATALSIEVFNREAKKAERIVLRDIQTTRLEIQD